MRLIFSVLRVVWNALCFSTLRDAKNTLAVYVIDWLDVRVLRFLQQFFGLMLCYVPLV